MGNELLYLYSMASALQNIFLKFTAHSVTVAPSVTFGYQ